MGYPGAGLHDTPSPSHALFRPGHPVGLRRFAKQSFRQPPSRLAVVSAPVVAMAAAGCTRRRLAFRSGLLKVESMGRMLDMDLFRCRIRSHDPMAYAVRHL